MLGPAFATLAAVLLPATLLALGRRMTNLSREQIIVRGRARLPRRLRPERTDPREHLDAAGLAANNVLAGFRAPLIGNDRLGIVAPGRPPCRDAGGRRRLELDPALDRPASPPDRARGRRSRGSCAAARGRSSCSCSAMRAELALFSLLGGLFDRYLYPMVPVAAILLLRQSARRRSGQPFRLGRSHALSHGAFAWLVAIGVHHRRELVRLRRGAVSRRRGGRGARIRRHDCRRGLRMGRHPRLGGPELRFLSLSGLTWWQDLFPSFRPCALLSNTPVDVPGYELIRENPSAYRQYLLFGPAQPLYLYGAHLAGVRRRNPVELTSGG